ncbi:MAG: ABC transporter permease subunit [Phycisphaerae bacterium]|nr:ABC transporter permease subunit [Phycisphaerae bacterium]
MKPIVEEVGLWLWRILPANPIVVRVVQGGSRRMQHLWIRAGYLTILFCVLLVSQYVQGVSSSLVELAKSSSQVFKLISTLQLAMTCLLAPIFTAGAISQEKDAETFNVLLTTPLTNAQIVLGSLMSRLFFVITLLVAGLPVFCITMLFGGVTSREILLSFGISACTAMVTGSLAILISVVRVGTRGTVFSFYVGIAFFLAVGLGLGWLPQTYVPESIVPGVSEGMTWLSLVHPYWALTTALNRAIPPDALLVADYTWPLNLMLAAPYAAYMLTMILVSGVLIGVATLFVRRGVKQGESNWGILLKRRLARLLGRDRKTRRARHVWSNPVAWREAVTRGAGASSGLMRNTYLIGGMLAAVLFLVLYGGGQFSTIASARQWLIGVVMVEFVMVLFMAANTAATAITRERDDGTMELLISTPLTSRYIIWGKLRGLISFAVPLMCVPAVTVLLAAGLDWFRGVDPPLVGLVSALILPLLLAVYAAFACMVGLQMSLKSARSVQAVLAAMAILVVAAFGLSACGFGAAGTGAEFGALIAPLTFVAAVILVLDPEQIMSAGRAAGGTAQSVQALMVIGTVVAVGLYGAIVAGTYRSMVNSFDVIVRKQSK